MRRASRERKIAPAQVPQMAWDASKGAQRLDQVEIDRQFADGGRFPAGDDQPGQAGEMLRQAHLLDIGA